MRYKNKNLSAFALIELLIVLAIIGIMSAVIIPSIGNYMKDKQEHFANQNAKIVFMEVQRQLNILGYPNKTMTVASARGTYDGSATSEYIVIDGSDVALDLKHSLNIEIRHGNWYAGIDNATKSVQFVVWVKDYSVPISTLQGITNMSQQKSYNSSVSSSKKIVGLYPRGT